MNKKIVSNVLALIMITIFAIITIPNESNAYSVSPASLNLTVGGTATITINSSGETGRYDVASSNSSVASVSPSSAWGENNSVSITVTAKTAGSATITVTPTDVSNSTTGSAVSGARQIAVTVSNPTPKPSPTPTPAPTFQSVNQTVYATTEVNVRASYSTSSSRIGSLQKGQSVTRTGIGNNEWSRVTFNGQTGYINSQYLTTTKPAEEPTTSPSTPPENKKSNDSSLKSLAITGVTLTPAFAPSVTSYVANIGTDINEVEVIAEVNNEKATKEIKGNTELKDGENIITVVVTAEDGTVTNYEIKLIRSNITIPLDVLTLIGIKENDERVDVSLGEPSITENIVEYTISLSEYMKAIDILKASNDDLNVYEGIGTFELKAGENKFTVVLKIAKDNEETQTIEYRLTINNPEKVVAKAETKVNYKLIVIISAIVLITLIGIAFAIACYRKQDNTEYAKPDYSFLREDEEKPKNTLEQIYDEKNNGQNDDDNDNYRRGGRHF